MGLYNVTSTPRGRYARFQRAHRLLAAAGLACVAAAGLQLGATPALAADSSSSQAGAAVPTVTLEILNANLLNVIEMLRQRRSAQFIVTGDPHLFRPVNVNVTAPLPQVLEYVAESAGAVITRDENGVYTIRPAGTPAPEGATDGAGAAPVSQTSVQPAVIKEPSAPLYYEKIVLNYVEPAFVVSVIEGDGSVSPYSFPGHDPVADATGPFGGPRMPQQQPLIQEVNMNPQPTQATMQTNGGNGAVAGVPIAGAAGTNPAALSNGQFAPVPGTQNGQNPFGQQPGQGGQVAGTLRPDGVTQIVVITEQNALLVRGTSQGIGELRELISKLDVPAKQVQIKVEFVTASVDAINQFGISFDLIPNPASEVGFFGAGPSGQGSVFLDYAHGNLVTKLAALLTSSKGRVISSPIITLTNNIQGSVFVTDQIPISQTTTIAQGNGNALQGTQVTYLAIPTGLSATARINGDDSVTLRMSPQLSTVTIPPGGGNPTVSSQTISTIRTVGNGETLVLGGLVQKTDVNSTEKFPFLADLPVIGNLFRTKDNSVHDSELLVFVTPTILPIPGSTTTGMTQAPTGGGFGVTP